MHSCVGSFMECLIVNFQPCLLQNVVVGRGGQAACMVGVGRGGRAACMVTLTFTM